VSHTTTVKSVPIRSITALEAAVQALQAKGVNCELVKDAKPRNFYRDQINRHIKAKRPNDFIFHDDPEECDYVLKLPDAYYDVGFLKDAKTGGLVPLFDDYNGYSTVLEWQYGKGPIRDYIGSKFEGSIEHWNGLHKEGETDQTLHSLGGLLRAYSQEAVIEAAAMGGHIVDTIEEQKDGTINIEISV